MAGMLWCWLRFLCYTRAFELASSKISGAATRYIYACDTRDDTGRAATDIDST